MRVERFAVLITAFAGMTAIAQQQGDGTHEPPTQPIAFSHKVHSGLKLKCQQCHPNPDPGDVMTLPVSERCMTCHATLAKDKTEVEKLAKFADAQRTIPWVRVYSVPAGVYWSHRSHLSAGIQCDTCHGEVASMDKTVKVTNVTTMDGCLRCHRERKAGTGCGLCHEER